MGIYNPNTLVDLPNGDVKSQCGANRGVAGNMLKRSQTYRYKNQTLIAGINLSFPRVSGEELEFADMTINLPLMLAGFD